MARIYATLKRQVVTGVFVPGARLDPARLQDDLAASTMPIRDALQRLTGEGLVENPQNEGFRVVQLGESAVRDLYDWCADIVHLCLGGADHHSDLSPDLEPAANYAEELTKLLLRIGSLSFNHERRRAMANLCERSFVLRLIEERLLDDPLAHVAAIKGALAERNWKSAGEAFDMFHKARVELLPSIVSSLRDRSISDRSIIF